MTWLDKFALIYLLEGLVAAALFWHLLQKFIAGDDQPAEGASPLERDAFRIGMGVPEFRLKFWGMASLAIVAIVAAWPVFMGWMTVNVIRQSRK